MADDETLVMAQTMHQARQAEFRRPEVNIAATLLSH